MEPIVLTNGDGDHQPVHTTIEGLDGLKNDVELHAAVLSRNWIELSNVLSKYHSSLVQKHQECSLLERETSQTSDEASILRSIIAEKAQQVVGLQNERLHTDQQLERQSAMVLNLSNEIVHLREELKTKNGLIEKLERQMRNEMEEYIVDIDTLMMARDRAGDGDERPSSPEMPTLTLDAPCLLLNGTTILHTPPADTSTPAPTPVACHSAQNTESQNEDDSHEPANIPLQLKNISRQNRIADEQLVVTNNTSVENELMISDYAGIVFKTEPQDLSDDVMSVAVTDDASVTTRAENDDISEAEDFRLYISAESPVSGSETARNLADDSYIIEENSDGSDDNVENLHDESLDLSVPDTPKDRVFDDTISEATESVTDSFLETEHYACGRCDAVFFTLPELKQHRKTHQCEMIYKCNICSKCWIHSGKLQVHMAVHSQERPFQCRLCETSYKSKGALSRHMVAIHHSATSVNVKKADVAHHTCENCQHGFTSQNALIIHQIRCTVDTPTKSMQTPRKESEQTPKKTPEKKKLLPRSAASVCLHSDATNEPSTPSTSENHTEPKAQTTSENRGKPADIICGKCDKYFTNLNTHMSEHVLEDRLYKCSCCGYSRLGLDGVRYHVETHSELKPYKCSNCGFKSKHRRSFYGHRRRGCCKPKNFNSKHNVGNKQWSDPKADNTKPESASSRKEKKRKEIPTSSDGNRSYQCKFCGRIFKDRRKCDAHTAARSCQEIRPGGKTLTCGNCKSTFHSVDDLVSHSKANYPFSEFSLNCDCGFTRRRPSKFRRHLISHSAMRRFECTNCGRKYKHKANFLRHRNRCRFSASVTKAAKTKVRKRGSPPGVANHMKVIDNWSEIINLEERQFTSCGRKRRVANCNAGRGYFSVDLLKLNIKDTSVSLPKYRKAERNDLPTVGTNTEERTDVTPRREPVSKNVDGTGRKYFGCSSCQQAFSECNQLEKHVQEHKVVPFPFRCTLCGNPRRRILALQCHVQKVHLGRRPRCTFCNKTFAGHATLTAHMRQHTRKPLKCTYCAQSFFRSDGLRRHVFIVHGKAPKEYRQCSECYKVFTGVSWLEQHMSNCHGVHGGQSRVRAEKHVGKSDDEGEGTKNDASSNGSKTQNVQNVSKPDTAPNGSEGDTADKRSDNVLNLLKNDNALNGSKTDTGVNQPRSDYVQNCPENTSAPKGTGNITDCTHTQSDERIPAKPILTAAPAVSPSIPTTKSTANIYTCALCKCVFSNIRSTMEHVSTHNAPGVALYKCNLCSKVCKHAGTLVNHVRIHDENAIDHRCTLCGKKYKSLAGLIAHNAVAHMNAKPGTGDTTDSKVKVGESQATAIPVLRSLLSDMNNNASENKEQTPDKVAARGTTSAAITKSGSTCDPTTVSQPSHIVSAAHEGISKPTAIVEEEAFEAPTTSIHLERGKNAHIPALQRPTTSKQNFTFVQCGLCALRFEDLEDLKNHARIHPSVKGAYKCKDCGVDFGRAYRLRNHLQSRRICSEKRNRREIEIKKNAAVRKVSHATQAETGQKSYDETNNDTIDSTRDSENGDNATKTGSDGSEIMTQEAERSGLDMYKCGGCERTFSRLTDLKSHKRSRVHEPDMYVCNVCGRAWPSPSALTQHIRFHTGEKPYKCSHCHQKFKQKHSCLTHELMHTHLGTDGMYACDVCGGKFTSREPLYSHLANHRKSQARDRPSSVLENTGRTGNDSAMSESGAESTKLAENGADIAEIMTEKTTEAERSSHDDAQSSPSYDMNAGENVGPRDMNSGANCSSPDSDDALLLHLESDTEIENDTDEELDCKAEKVETRRETVKRKKGETEGKKPAAMHILRRSVRRRQRTFKIAEKSSASKVVSRRSSSSAMSTKDRARALVLRSLTNSRRVLRSRSARVTGRVNSNVGNSASTSSPHKHGILTRRRSVPVAYKEDDDADDHHDDRNIFSAQSSASNEDEAAAGTDSYTAPTYQCKVCDVPFSSRENLRTHVQSYHRDGSGRRNSR